MRSWIRSLDSCVWKKHGRKGSPLRCLIIPREISLSHVWWGDTLRNRKKKKITLMTLFTSPPFPIHHTHNPPLHLTQKSNLSSLMLSPSPFLSSLSYSSPWPQPLLTCGTDVDWTFLSLFHLRTTLILSCLYLVHCKPCRHTKSTIHDHHSTKPNI